MDGFLHALAANPRVEFGDETKAAIEDWVQRFENAARTIEDSSYKIEAATENFGAHVTRMRNS